MNLVHHDQNRVCTGRGYENEIEQMLFKSKNNMNFDFAYSRNDYNVPGST